MKDPDVFVAPKRFGTMSYLVNNDWTRNQYQNLGEAHATGRSTVRSIFNSALIGLFLCLPILLLWNVSHYKPPNADLFYLNTRQQLLHTTSKRFLSFGLDSSLLRHMKSLPISNERFVNLSRYLSPAFVRFGGTSADCLLFKQTSLENSGNAWSPVDGQDISNFTITDKDFLAMYQYANRSELRMIFDLNVLLRKWNGFWNDANARKIIVFAKNHDMELDWQLGNEPNSFRHVFNVTITAEQLASDYIRLRRLLTRIGYGGSLLVGPEVNHVGDDNREGEIYAETFLKNDLDSVDYLTWHQYYLDGHVARLQDFLNPATFNYLPMQIKSMAKAVAGSGKNISMWLSETSSAYGSGAPGLSDRFVAGFLWLDKLGYSASSGLNVVTRQSLFGGYYAMIGPDLLPNPDWWVSVLFKRLVSEKVLALKTSNNFGLVRMYAHCTPRDALINGVPAVTVYGVNVDKVPREVVIGGAFPVLDDRVRIFFYALTSRDLSSREIRLNGKLLSLREDGSLPPLRPIIMEPSRSIVLPPYSMVFMVLHGVEVASCND